MSEAEITKASVSFGAERPCYWRGEATASRGFNIRGLAHGSGDWNIGAPTLDAPMSEDSRMDARMAEAFTLEALMWGVSIVRHGLHWRLTTSKASIMHSLVSATEMQKPMLEVGEH